MTNPIHPPSPDGSPYTGPLLFFEERVDHLPLFAFIDSMYNLLNERFGTAVTAERILVRGHLILVYGRRGAGKSTFVQRCAYRLAKEIELERVCVADYSQATGHQDCEDFHQMALWLARQMTVLLEEEEWTVHEDVASLRETTDDPNAAFGRIRDVLNERNGVAVILLPAYLPLTWVRGFQELARRRMVFFAESDSDDAGKLAHHFGRLPTCHTIFLPIGSLDGGGSDIREILVKRQVSLGDAEMNELSAAVRDFTTPRQALEHLAVFFDEYGTENITFEKIKAFKEKLVPRLLAEWERDRQS